MALTDKQRELGYSEYRVAKNNKVRYVVELNKIDAQYATQEQYGFFPDSEEIEKVN